MWDILKRTGRVLGKTGAAISKEYDGRNILTSNRDSFKGYYKLYHPYLLNSTLAHEYFLSPSVLEKEGTFDGSNIWYSDLELEKNSYIHKSTSDMGDGEYKVISDLHNLYGHWAEPRTFFSGLFTEEDLSNYDEREHYGQQRNNNYINQAKQLQKYCSNYIEYGNWEMQFIGPDQWTIEPCLSYLIRLAQVDEQRGKLKELKSQYQKRKEKFNICFDNELGNLDKSLVLESLFSVNDYLTLLTNIRKQTEQKKNEILDGIEFWKVLGVADLLFIMARYEVHQEVELETAKSRIQEIKTINEWEEHNVSTTMLQPLTHWRYNWEIKELLAPKDAL